MSCELYFAEMSHLPPFFPLHSSSTCEWLPVWVCIYYHMHVCVYLILACLWLCACSLLAHSIWFLREYNFKQQLSAVVKDSISLESTLGCV